MSATADPVSVSMTNTSPLALLAVAAEAVHAYQTAATAPATRLAYRSDMALFSAWCDARGVPPVPATPTIVAAYLAEQAATGSAKASTLGRRAAAIAYAHRLAGIEPPTASEAVRAVLRGIRRTLGVAKARKVAATANVIRALLNTCPDTLRDKRDRALIALGFAGAFRRSELVALTVADLVEVTDGLRVMIRRSKTDQDGVGHEVAIPRGYKLRPVDAVKDWLAAAAITEGPVFRPLGKGGRVLPGALDAESVADVVKLAATRAGLDAASFAGHSLRSGFITSAAEAGATIAKMQAVSRHKSVDVLLGYVRSADAFHDHAGAAFL